MDLFCAGELNVDLVLSGFQSAPTLGTEIMGDDYTVCLGSSTAICACVAASLGTPTGFYGRLGCDHFGRVALEGLKKYSVETEFIDVSSQYRTGLTVSVSTEKDRAMATCFGDTIDAFASEEIPLERANARHIHIASYFIQPKVRGGLAAVYRRAKALGMTTSLDAGWDEQERWHDGLFDILPYTDFFFPNEREAEAITGVSDMPEAARRIAAMGTNAVVKCGSEGVVLCEKHGGRPVRIPGFRAKVIDTTGAGDSFNGGFLHAFLRGMPLEECARFGNAAGAVSVTRLGGTTSCPTLEDVLGVLRTGTAKEE